MSEKHENHDHSAEQAAEPTKRDDQASMFLANALKSSFLLLKTIMIVLVIVFVISGFKTIEPFEKALVLTFGKITGQAEDRVLEPGLKWVWPSPIQELVRIPVGKKMTMDSDSFWYFQRNKLKSVKDRERFGETLNPQIDGYCLTRGQANDGDLKSDTDYNIVHTSWQLTYQITDSESFYTNNYIELSQLQAGQNYADLIEPSLAPMLKALLDAAVVGITVKYNIDDVLYGKVGSVTENVKRKLQQSLNELNTGITVVSVQLNRSPEPPRQVAAAFWASVQAAQLKEKLIEDTKSYYDKTLNETAGPVAEQLLEGLESLPYDSEKLGPLWAQLSGQSQDVISQAQAYRTQVVENARANADYFNSLLPEYQKRPKLVLQKIWQDMVQEVIGNVDEQMIIQPAAGANNREIRVQINRDPAVKKKKNEDSKQ